MKNLAAGIPPADVLLDEQMQKTFSALRDAGVDYVVLRGYRPLSELNESIDVDLFVPAAQMAAARPAILQAGWRERRYQAGRFPHLFFDAWDAPTSVVRSLDVVTSLCFGADLLALQRDHLVADSGEWLDGVRVPNPWMAAFAFALHVALDKGFLSPANANRAAAMIGACHDRPGDRSLLVDSYGQEAAELVDALAGVADRRDAGSLGEFVDRARRLPCLRSQGSLGTTSRWRARLRDLARPVVRVAFLGCDGAGKSTLTRKLKDTPSTQRINTAYLGVNEFLTPPAKWFQKKLKAYSGEAAERSIGYRVLRNLDQLWWPAEVLARMAYAEHRHAVVLYDRFPFRESREGHRPATPWGRVMAAYQDLAMRPVRMPDIVIFLDGDPHTIWSRKKEYPFETYLKVRQDYVDLLGRLPCETYTVASDQGIEATFRQVKDVLARSPSIQRKLYLGA